MQFQADPDVAAAMAAQAADLIELGRQRYGVTLDLTLASAPAVERIAADMVTTKPPLARFRPSVKAQAQVFASMLGGYLAETLVRSVGGRHGWVAGDDGVRFPGVELPDGSLCWPIGKAQQRLAGDPSADLAIYVAVLASPPA